MRATGRPMASRYMTLGSAYGAPPFPTAWTRCSTGRSPSNGRSGHAHPHHHPLRLPCGEGEYDAGAPHSEACPAAPPVADGIICAMPRHGTRREDGTPAPASVPRHVLARWQSQCGGTSHHTHRGAVQERGWTFDPTHHGTVQGPTGRMAFFIRNGGMMRRSI